MGELDNTYMIYTADHGMAICRHGLQGKQNLYEHTWRVPLVVKSPGIKPGSRANGNVYLLNTLATLCSLAGIQPPANNEGINLEPVLKGRTQTVRETLYGVYSGGTKPGMRSVRHGDWKLIKYDVMDGSVRKTQLFNLKENPHELLREHHALRVFSEPIPMALNLAESPKHAAKRKELEALLLREMNRLNDPFRLWDQPQK